MQGDEKQPKESNKQYWGLSEEEENCTSSSMNKNSEVKKKHANKQCVSCFATKTCRWRRSKIDALVTLCDKCYRKEALTLTKRQCYVCNTTKTTGQWFRSKLDNSFDLCRNCWVKEHAILANKQCTSCKSKTTSSQWLKSKLVEGADLCNNCYQKEVYQLQKYMKSMQKDGNKQ